MNGSNTSVEAIERGAINTRIYGQLARFTPQEPERHTPPGAKPESEVTEEYGDTKRRSHKILKRMWYTPPGGAPVLYDNAARAAEAAGVRESTARSRAHSFYNSSLENKEFRWETNEQENAWLRSRKKPKRASSGKIPRQIMASADGKETVYISARKAAQVLQIPEVSIRYAADKGRITRRGMKFTWMSGVREDCA